MIQTLRIPGKLAERSYDRAWMTANPAQFVKDFTETLDSYHMDHWNRSIRTNADTVTLVLTRKSQ